MPTAVLRRRGCKAEELSVQCVCLARRSCSYHFLQPAEETFPRGFNYGIYMGCARASRPGYASSPGAGPKVADHRKNRSDSGNPFMSRHPNFREFGKCSQSGAATLIRQSRTILDIATAICSRSNCAIGFVNQHRVLSLMEGLCRTANSCKAGMVVGALRIACNGLCTAARFHTADGTQDAFWAATGGLDCIRHYNQCPTLFEFFRSLWPGTGECISPTAIFNELLFKIAVQSGFASLVLGFLMRSSQSITCRETMMALVSISKDLCMEELR